MWKAIRSATALLALSLLLTGCAGRLDPRFLGCIVSGGDPEACFRVLNPPGVPVNVAAGPLRAEQAIRVSWEEPNGGADSYVVARGDFSGGPYTDLGEPNGDFPNTHVDRDVEPGRTYHYVVYAVNENGRTRSGEVSTCWCVERPAAPENVRAEASARGIRVSWSSVLDAATYELARSETTGGPYSVISTQSGNTVEDQSVEPFRTYFYVVAAVNVLGASPQSAEASAEWRPGVPAAPANLVGLPTHPAGIQLNWDAVADADSYVVARADSAGGPYTDVGSARGFRSFLDDTAQLGRTYFYVVHALNPAGRSGPSDEVALSWTPQPDPPVEVRAVSGSRGIRVTWRAEPSFAGSYVVARSNVPGGPRTDIGTARIGELEDTQVEIGRRFWYVVHAVPDVGVRSEPSVEVSAIWCGPSCSFATRRPGLSYAATLTTTTGSPGSLALAAGRLVSSGATAEGTLELTVDGRSFSGTWTSATDFALDLAGGKGAEAGLLVATLEGGGRACLRIRNEYAGASTARGSFTLAGSDGDPAALLAGAAYTGRVEEDGRLVLDGRGRQARFGTLPLGCSADLRAPLEELRDAAGPRLRAHLDAALEPALWSAGRPASADVLLALRKALRHATLEQRRTLAEIGRNAAEAQAGAAFVAGADVGKAAAHLDSAASHPGTAAALEDAIRAWTALGPH